MTDSRFWRLMAIFGVAGLFYVGYGLNRNSDPNSAWLAQKASASGVAVQSAGNPAIAITASPDGKTVYFFGPATAAIDFGFDKFLGKLTAP